MAIKLKALPRAKAPTRNLVWGILVEGVTQTTSKAQVKFASTVATWNDQPVFEKTLRGKTAFSKSIVGTAKTKHQKYDWVNNGTKGPYPIPKAGPGVLAFKEGFVPKTQPGVIASGPGARFGDTLIRSRVMHPGIKPRKFDVEIKRQIEPVFYTNMRIALDKVEKLF